MNVYTFVLDFRGGTYLSQVEAVDPFEAKAIWASNLDYKNIEGIGKKTKKDLIIQVDDEEPIPIVGLKKVWCISVLLRGHLGMVHYVQTEID